jgi:hypothetical protein
MASLLDFRIYQSGFALKFITLASTNNVKKQFLINLVHFYTDLGTQNTELMHHSAAQEQQRYFQ